MAAISIYQGNTRTISVSLTNQDGTPYNASGAILYYTVRPDYNQPPFFNIGVTGLGTNLANASTGLFIISLTTGNTDLCPGFYQAAGFTFVDVNKGISTFGTDGLNILAAPLIL